MGQPASHSRTFGSAAVLAVSLATVLAACGGGGGGDASRASASDPSGTTTRPGASGASGSSGAVRAAGSFQGASGSVAAISGSSMEVQNPSTGQTTVNWTGTTTFDQTVALTASSLAAGDCVTVTGATTNGTITARSVTITAAASSGTCSRTFGTRRGGLVGRPRNGSRPAGSVPRRGGQGASAGSFGFAAGKVVSSSSTRLVIFGTSFGRPGRRTATSTPPTTAAPADMTVEMTSSTSITQVRPATAGSLAVGDCVVANGPADSTGAVTARTVRITSTGGKTCVTGFGRFGGGSPAGYAPASSASTNG